MDLILPISLAPGLVSNVCRVCSSNRFFYIKIVGLQPLGNAQAFASTDMFLQEQ